jgi:hypothetical protein
MSEGRSPVHTGGCQCGAVRFALYAEPGNPHICHCRMCQKQFGSFFAPLCNVPLADFAWTRGTPGAFRSSQAVERGFCRDCGTPLSFRYLDQPRISVAIGALDDPRRVAPAKAYGLESRMPWFDSLPGLPGTTTQESVPEPMRPRLASRQHPDHDTERWPPA